MLFNECTCFLHPQIDNFPPNLVLPSLPSFNKLDPQRLEVRKTQLENYLKTITSEEFLSDHLNVLGHVILFLSEGEYECKSSERQRVVRKIFLQAFLYSTYNNYVYVHILCACLIIIYTCTYVYLRVYFQSLL